MDLKQVIEELKERGYKYVGTKSGLAGHLLTTADRVAQLEDNVYRMEGRLRVYLNDVARKDRELVEKQETIDSLLMCIRMLREEKAKTWNIKLNIAKVPEDCHGQGQNGCSEKAGK